MHETALAAQPNPVQPEFAHREYECRPDGRIIPPPPAKIRGLLPHPPEVVTMVDEVHATRPASPAYRQMMLDVLSCQYYFGGHSIAYRETEQGREVLAVGLDEMGNLRESMTPAERVGVIWGHCDLW